MNDNGYQLPVYIAKGVYSSGHIADIGPLQIGIFDNNTHSVATGTGNGREFYLAGGSLHTKDKLSKWFGGMLDPKKSEVFKGHDIHTFEKSTPQRPQSEQWVVGYDGSKSSVGLQFEPDKLYYLKIRLYGQPVLRYWGNDIERLVHLWTGWPAVVSDCDTPDCTAPTFLGAKTQVRAWVKAINDNPDLKEFGIKAYPVFSDFSATATTATLNGTGTAATLSPVVTDGKVTAITVLTAGAYSVAPTTVTIAGAGTGATATVQTTGSSPNISVTGITVTAAGTGYSNTSTVFKYTLKVTDNGDPAALQAIQRFYAATNNISRLSYTRGTSTYITDYLASAPANFQPKTFSYPADCGACLGGDTLTASQDLYTVRRQMASSTDTHDSTTTTAYAAQIVTDYSGISGSGVFAGVINGEATVNFKHAATTNPLAALNSDFIVRSGVTEAMCTPSAPSAIAWVVGDGAYVTSRTFTITLPNEDCNNAPTLAQVQGHLSSTPGVVSGNVTDITDNSGGGILQDNCTKVFQVVQTSYPTADKYCMSIGNVDYADIPNFRGSVWEETVATETYDANLKVGIRIVAPFVSQQFGIDSYDVKEYYDIDPTLMEVSLWSDDAIIPSQMGTLAKARRVVNPQYARLSGNFVLQHYIARNSAYRTFEEWAADPRNREVIDNTILSQLKREAWYVAYYVKYTSKKDRGPHQKGEEWDSIIYVDETDKATQDALEVALQSVTSRFGVYLTNRGK
jgi:hypothetical protein